MNRTDRLRSVPWWRIGISVLIIGHLWGVLGRPLEFATQGPTGASPAASLFYAPVRGYSQFAYLNHGYAFFAPNPGPSHLIRVRVPREDEQTEEYLYPDLRRQWPRLLYHRHFMLTEFLHNTFQPARMPEPVAMDAELAAQWQNDRKRYEAVRGSMQRHLAQVHQSDELAIQRVEHQLVGLPEFLNDRLPLDDPRLYIDLPEEVEEVFEEAGQGWGTPAEPERPGRPTPLPRFGAPNQPREAFPGRGQ